LNTLETQGSSIDPTGSVGDGFPINHVDVTMGIPVGSHYADPVGDVYRNFDDSYLPINQHLYQNPQHNSEDPMFGQRVDGSASLQMSAEQLYALQRYCRKWEARHRFPNSEEISSLAKLEELCPDDVLTWLLRHFNFPLAYQQELQPMPPAPPSAVHDDVMSDDKSVRQDVIEFARHRFSKNCSSGQARKAHADLNFICTSPNCGYSTDIRDAWQRHEQKWQPQEFWYCILCRQAGRKTIYCRKDKFPEHFPQSHPHVAKEHYARWRELSKVEFKAGFEVRCKFWNANGQCGYVFTSWADRTSHYLEHFRKKIDNGPWNLAFSRNKWFDDEGDGSGSSYSNGMHHRSSGHGSGNKKGNHQNSYSNYTASGGSTSNSSGIQDADIQNRPSGPLSYNGAEVKQSNRTISSAEHLTTQDSLPHWLIDVGHFRLVKPPPDAKYLALDHSFHRDHMDPTPPVCITTTGPSQKAQQEFIHLPVAFQNAIKFARDLGYQYLWIAEICEPRCHISTLRDIHERAALTILPVKGCRNPRQALHFTCHYQDIQLVYSWANHKHSIRHIQNLGHGSFGIVDEVRMPSTRQTYARKEVQESRCQRKNMRAWNLQEIEIMRKLNHPHIARFVAAYYEHERRSLNIIMTPVAECNLKDYLADPLRWPSKQDHLSRWFLSLASALSYLHNAAGIRHKDIKPANILISGQNVFLSDFGISHEFSPDDSESYGAGVMMTPKYSAPEVAARNRRGRKADIYSLGCVYLEMATVMLSFELTELQKFLSADADVDRSQTAYHQLLPRLNSWLLRLRRVSTTAAESRLLFICNSMIEQQPHRRPSASDVYKALCNGTDVTSTDICACCWRQEKRTILEALSHANTSISIAALSLLAQQQAQGTAPMLIPQSLSDVFGLGQDLSHRSFHRKINFSMATIPKVNTIFILTMLGSASLQRGRLKSTCNLKNFSSCELCSVPDPNACLGYSWTFSAPFKNLIVDICHRNVLTRLVLKLKVNIKTLLEKCLTCHARQFHHPTGVSNDIHEQRDLLRFTLKSLSTDTNASTPSQPDDLHRFTVTDNAKGCKNEVSSCNGSIHFEGSKHNKGIQLYRIHDLFRAWSELRGCGEGTVQTGTTEQGLSSNFNGNEIYYEQLLKSYSASDMSLGQGVDRDIDVSDLGIFSEKNISAAFARQARCACNRSALPQQRGYLMSEENSCNLTEGVNGEVLFSEILCTKDNSKNGVQQDVVASSESHVIWLSQWWAVTTNVRNGDLEPKIGSDDL